jgi:hypothetical protein
LLGSGAVQRAFGNDFSCRNALCFEVGDFIALREPTSAQGFTPGILLDDNFTVSLGDLLLDDSLLNVAIFLGRLSLLHSK